MKTNYWQEYWESYLKFMSLYLNEFKKAYPNADIKQEYTEVAKLFEPSRLPDDYEIYDEYDYDTENSYLVQNNNQPNTPPQSGQSPNPFILPGGIQLPNPFAPPGGGQSPNPFISPGSGQFTINNCRKMAIVKIVMRRGFNPSNFYMVVDRADNRSIQGFRIACESGRVRFVAMAIEYRNINIIECVF